MLFWPLSDLYINSKLSSVLRSESMEKVVRKVSCLWTFFLTLQLYKKIYIYIFQASST